MSVFQLQEWWSTKLSDHEEFDHGCMYVGNIDNANPPTEKICIGSLQGYLRIYHPTRPQFKVEDLVLEENTGAPILQVLGGKFIPSTEMLGLAVLHPRRLTVYEVVPQANRDGRINFHSLTKAYQHDLGLDGKHFTAYNMTCGSLGGVVGREMFVVQSLDGKIQILEQSANAFSRQLVDCLIPGPVAYMPKLDAFVTVNHACQAECYRYQVLASSQADIGSKDAGVGQSAFGITTVRSALVEWSIDLGEPCRQILEGCFSTSTVEYNKAVSELIMVCDKSLFLLKGESGGVIQQKRLERSDASCVCAYPVTNTSSGTKSNNFLLATQDATVQVYSGFNLVWAAKTTSVPVQMAVTNFGNQRGIIVTIDDSGTLALNYLGTRPPISAVTSHVREMNYEKIDEEHRALLQVIRESQNENKAEPTERLLIRSQVSKTLDMEHVDSNLPPDLVPAFQSVAGMASDQNAVKICVRVYLTYTGDKSATDVSLVVSSPAFVHALPKSVTLPRVNGVKSTPVMVKVFFYASKKFLASSLDANITASYTSSRGEPRVATHAIQLPLCVACRPKPPMAQGATAKLILDTDYPAQPLTDLFDDFLYAAQESGLELTEALGSNATQAMGFQLFSSGNLSSGPSAGVGMFSPNASSGSQAAPLVSVLVSKNAGRYRVQSSSFPALYLVMSELERRLTEKLESLRMSGVKVGGGLNGEPAAATSMMGGGKGLVRCTDSIPVEEYFEAIKAHFDTRKAIVALNSQLNNYAHQLRLVQKRLLVRFKDKNPTPIGGLDFLLKETYQRIIDLGDQVEQKQMILKQQASQIECFSKLVVLVASLKYNMTPEERSLFESHLCPEIKDGDEQGWEETVDASITYLLKTSLAKNVKESAHLTGTTLELPASIESLRKHFNMVIDRLDKGGRIAVPLPSTPKGPGQGGAGAGGSGSASHGSKNKKKHSVAAPTTD